MLLWALKGAPHKTSVSITSHLYSSVAIHVTQWCYGPVNGVHHKSSSSTDWAWFFFNSFAISESQFSSDSFTTCFYGPLKELLIKRHFHTIHILIPLFSFRLLKSVMGPLLELTINPYSQLTKLGFFLNHLQLMKSSSVFSSVWFVTCFYGPLKELPIKHNFQTILIPLLPFRLVNNVNFNWLSCLFFWYSYNICRALPKYYLTYSQYLVMGP